VQASTSMATQEYDLVTIGAGSGGVRASRFAAQYYNAKVAVVELPFGFVSSDDIGGGHEGRKLGKKQRQQHAYLLRGASKGSKWCQPGMSGRQQVHSCRLLLYSGRRRG